MINYYWFRYYLSIDKQTIMLSKITELLHSLMGHIELDLMSQSEAPLELLLAHLPEDHTNNQFSWGAGAH